MSDSIQVDDNKALAQAIVNDFHEYFSSPPPFTNGSRYVLPHALITSPLPPALGGLTTETFAHMYERVSPLLLRQYDSGLKSFRHRLAEPDAEVWVSGNIAAVFVGWSASVDDRDIVHAVHICSLHRINNQDSNSGNPWRISGLVDMMHLSPEIQVPPVETGPVLEIIAPLEALLTYIDARDWEAILPLLLPGGGATISQGSRDPVTFLWPEFIKQLQVEAESGTVTKKKLFNCEVRRCSDLAFVWAPFMLIADGGREYGQGVNICSFRLEEGQWLISGLQDTSSNK